MVAPAAKVHPVKHTSTVDGKQLQIWGDPAVVKYFFPTLTAATDTDPVEATIAVKARSRKQYPGDTTPVQQGAHNRKVLKGGSWKHQVTPGRVFTCEEEITVGLTKKMHVSTLTLVGAYRDLYMLAVTDGKPGKWWLRSPGGRSRPINDVTPAAANA